MIVLGGRNKRGKENIEAEGEKRRREGGGRMEERVKEDRRDIIEDWRGK